MHRKWLPTPNGLSLSVLGINMKEAIPWFPGWSLVGALEAGFNPYSGILVNGPRSLVQNNGLPLVLQSANSDSSRAGQFDNSVRLPRLQQPDFRDAHLRPGDLAARSTPLAYDPMGGSYAFSAIGFSGSFASFGDTETNRAEHRIQLSLSYGISAAGAWCSGAAMLGNGSNGLFQGDIGADIEDLFGGLLSVDLVGSYAQNAVSLSNFAGSCATPANCFFNGETTCTSGIPNFYGPET